MKMRRVLLAFGIVCLTAALGLSVYNLASSDRAATQAADVVEALTPLMTPPIEEEGGTANAVPSVPMEGDHPDREMPTVELDSTRYVGRLEIPELRLNLPVAASFSMKQLTKTPALYAGSVYGGDMVIAAHNYNSHFGRLNQLEVGDEVRFVATDGRVYRYVVGWSEKMAPSESEEMVEDANWDLTLFTCTYNGKQRFTLRCVAAGE